MTTIGGVDILERFELDAWKLQTSLRAAWPALAALQMLFSTGTFVFGGPRCRVLIGRYGGCRERARMRGW